MTEPLAEAADAIRSASHLVLACHVNPDGDALGSLLGLALGLSSMGKTLTLLSQDGVPEPLRFLPHADAVRTLAQVAPASFDLAVVLDSGDLTRVGDAVLPFVRSAPRILNIDHHAAGAAFGDVRLIDATAASTSELVFRLLQTLEIPLTPDIAACLFTGVTTDTGGFRFANVTPATLQTAAALVAAGAAPAAISEQVFDNRTFAATVLLGRALAGLSQTDDGRIVWARVRLADFLELGATDEDTEGIVNFARGVRGADAGILFREMADGKIRISLRARASVDVGAVAQKFGGGGHRMAAGCSLSLPLAEAENAIVDVVRAAMA